MSNFILSLIDKLLKKRNYFSHVIWKQFSRTIYFLIKIFLVYFALYHELKCKVFTILLAKYLINILYGKIFFFFSSFTFIVNLYILRVFLGKLSEYKSDFPPFSFKLCAFRAGSMNNNEWSKAKLTFQNGTVVVRKRRCLVLMGRKLSFLPKVSNITSPDHGEYRIGYVLK